MTRNFTSPYIYGIHDRGGEYLMIEAGCPGWVVFTHALNVEKAGFDYRPWSDQGLGVIARLNWGYYQTGYRPGTIPDPLQYYAFAGAVGEWVARSQGCTTWIIGNEPNYLIEWPNGRPISPLEYASCFWQCAEDIHRQNGHKNDAVVTAAIAPWNIDCGDWIDYFASVLDLVGPEHLGGIAVHTYTDGADPALVYEHHYMNPPYNHRHYHFLAYQDFMEAIPQAYRHLPVYITETDQNRAWADENRGWVQRAYGEINHWNLDPTHQKIHCLALYRWQHHDQFGIEGKNGVITDFRESMRCRYAVT